MFLKSISFSYTPKDGTGWEIENYNLNFINLIAGKNASGKTRLLRSIQILVGVISSNNLKLPDNVTFHWVVTLENAEKENIIYEFECTNNIVLLEKLEINGKTRLSRGADGKGSIWYDEIGKNIEFEVEKNKIVAASRRDKKQHPFLENLFKWSNNVFLYKFGTQLGRETVYTIKTDLDTFLQDNDELAKIDKDDETAGIKFEIGTKKYPGFKEKILKDFNRVGYSVKDMGVTYYRGEQVDSPYAPSVLYVIEQDLTNKIFQSEVSQGMFRVLSLLIQVNYLEFNLSEHSTILIDDIGEGLDFERSTNLIKLLIEKAESLKEKIQLVMTTNDRFVMNNVPLDYWTVVDRSNGKIHFYSKKTNPEAFEKFEDIGLNNFDFFSGEYYK
jgi:AAA15 family ATPase/GTPase